MNQHDDYALVWSASAAHLGKFARFGYEMVRNDGQGRLFKVPKASISFRKPRKTDSLTGKVIQTRCLTEEQRRKASERMKLMHSAKSIKTDRKTV